MMNDATQQPVAGTPPTGGKARGARNLVRHAILFGMLALLPPWPGVAADISVALTPGSSTVAFRAYGLGLFPLDGQFARFHGRFTYDPAAPAHCSVMLQVDVPSLAMDPTYGGMVLGPEFLDAARFPGLAYQGTCDADAMNGLLTMHGVSRPFALTLDRGRNEVTAVGSLRRADWGMTARPLLGGSTVRITVTVPLSAPARIGG